MPTPKARNIAFLRSVQLLGIELIGTTSARISSWLVLGNGGALVLLLGAIVGGQSLCDLPQLRPSIWLFAAGLGLAFIGAATGLIAGVRTGKMIGDAVEGLAVSEMNEYSIEQLEKRHGPHADGSILEKSIEDNMEKAKVAIARLVRFQRIMVFCTLTPSVLSIIAFGVGLSLPLTEARLLASCAG